ncbi:MAG: hypothetical protein JWO48_3833 [Bryobacterales bacterium]|nr:hypothetical protein [Bryobacterales bacterium]
MTTEAGFPTAAGVSDPLVIPGLITNQGRTYVSAPRACHGNPDGALSASSRPQGSSTITVAPFCAACTTASVSPRSSTPCRMSSISNTSMVTLSYSLQRVMNAYERSSTFKRSLVARRLNNSARTAFGRRTRGKRKLSCGKRSRRSRATTHDVSIVQIGASTGQFNVHWVQK